MAALRLLTLSGARLSEVLGLRWDEIGEDGASVRLEDSKTGRRTVWLGPEAARLVATLPRRDGGRGAAEARALSGFDRATGPSGTRTEGQGRVGVRRV